MASHDSHSRTPMASRRVRRHATGTSNISAQDDSASSISRSTVSLIHADKVIKVPQRDRPAGPVARETRVEDRPTVNRVHDKLFKTHGERYVHRVLRRLAPDGSGLLGREQLRAALDLLHVGLDPGERDRIVARVLPEGGSGGSRVHYLDFMRSLEAPQPLGGEEVAAARGLSVPGPPPVRPGGGGHGVGDGGTSYWNWQRHPKERIPGLLDAVREGSPEQAQSDALLTSLLAAKLAQYPDKLRLVFRQMDSNKNSVIDREEFAKGLAKLRIAASRPQVDRLFDLADSDHNGVVDYEEFVRRFEEHGLMRQNTDQTKERLRAASLLDPPLSQSLALSHDEVAGALKHPLAHELVRSLYGKGRAAAAVFQRHDLARSGRLDVAGMAACCQALVPGIGERQVAALMCCLEPASTGHVDYRAFVDRLVEGGPQHPRLAHSAPPGGHGKGGGERGALARFGEPLSEPAALPSQHTRALSAVSLSRTAHTDGPGPGPGPGPESACPSGGPPQPLAATVATSERSALHDLHEVAVAPLIESLNRASGAVPGDTGAGGALPAVTRSVDVGVLARSLQQQQQQEQAGAAAGRTEGSGSSSRAPSHATGRFSRFWTRRYADTSSVTCPLPGSSLYSSAEGSFVRKGQGDHFLAYQSADREREAKRRQELVQRYNHRSDIDSRYSAQDDASGADGGRLAVARAARQRYEERCEMYDRLRQRDSPADHTFFGRNPAFDEHKSDAANESGRAYW